MPSAKRNRILEQSPDQEGGGRAKVIPALELAQAPGGGDKEEQQPASLELEIARISIGHQWYAYIL